MVEPVTAAFAVMVTLAGAVKVALLAGLVMLTVGADAGRLAAFPGFVTPVLALGWPSPSGSRSSVPLEKPSPSESSAAS
jgi:hypothetical protein